MHKTLLILLFGFLFCFGRQPNVYGQQTVFADSISTQQDTITGKKEKGTYSGRSKVVSRVHKWLFRKEKGKKAPPKIKYAELYGDLQDKVTIDHVIIESKDPFGYSVFDTLRKPKSLLEKAGNAVHVKSKNMAIKKYFLFKEGDLVDTLLIQETARLLRQQKYIRDVNIVPEHSIEGTVNLVVKVLDSWSILPRGSFSSSRFSVGLRDRNFFGLGHEAHVNYSKRIEDGSTGFGSKYIVPNIANTFIDVTGNYQSDLDHFQDKYISMNREFYSPLTRWAGGVFVQERSLERPFIGWNWEIEDHQLKFDYQDYWLGRAFPIIKAGEGRARQTNLVVAARTFFVNYKAALPQEIDNTRFFSDEQFYLASVGVNSREYVADHHIFRDGVTEDVPVGDLYSFTAGVQRKNERSRFYMGVQASKGGYVDWGFVSGTVEIGSFFGSSRVEQGVISLKANYFSDLYDMGSGGWQIRQFIKPQIVIGINREKSFNDRLGLNERPYFRGVNNYEYLDYTSRYKYGDYQNGNMQGFESPVIGTRKYVLDLQTQFYSPWELLGFRLNPFLSTSLSILTGGDKSYGSNRLYSSFSLGFIIRNDYFVFDSFQLSLSYYPSIPGEGNSIFKGNSFRNDNFGFLDFKSDKPRPVIYE